MLSPEAIDLIFDDDNYVEVDERWLQAAKEKTNQTTRNPRCLNHTARKHWCLKTPPRQRYQTT